MEFSLCIWFDVRKCWVEFLDHVTVLTIIDMRPMEYGSAISIFIHLKEMVLRLVCSGSMDIYHSPFGVYYERIQICTRV
jgi:hypothetical protein